MQSVTRPDTEKLPEQIVLFVSTNEIKNEAKRVNYENIRLCLLALSSKGLENYICLQC